MAVGVIITSNLYLPPLCRRKSLSDITVAPGANSPSNLIPTYYLPALSGQILLHPRSRIFCSFCSRVPFSSKPSNSSARTNQCGHFSNELSDIHLRRCVYILTEKVHTLIKTPSKNSRCFLFYAEQFLDTPIWSKRCGTAGARAGDGGQRRHHMSRQIPSGMMVIPRSQAYSTNSRICSFV